MFQLRDDGTLDTVVACTDCGHQERFTFQPDSYDDETYDDFVAWALDEAAACHDCLNQEAAHDRL
jgi:hypothetical protein